MIQHLTKQLTADFLSKNETIYLYIMQLCQLTSICVWVLFGAEQISQLFLWKQLPAIGGNKAKSEELLTVKLCKVDEQIQSMIILFKLITVSNPFHIICKMIFLYYKKHWLYKPYL